MATNNFLTDTIAVISGGRSGTVKFDSWRHWEIVGELVWRGANRFDAEDAAKWAAKAPIGLEKTIKPGILLKIRKDLSKDALS